MAATITRFSMRIDPWWRPFLLFVAATPANSYAEFDGSGLRLCFGRGFNHTIAINNIARARRSSWSFINGIGVRAGGRTLGLIGSTSGVVELELRAPATLRFVGWPWSATAIAVSLQNPEAFIQHLEDALMANGDSPSPMTMEPDA